MKRITAIILCIAIFMAFASFASAYEGENYIVFSDSSKVTVPKNQHIVGDSNGDGKVTMLDIATSLKYITGDTSKSLRDSIDTNSDGIVNMADVLLIIKYVLGDKSSLGELVG